MIKKTGLHSRHLELTQNMILGARSHVIRFDMLK